MARLRAAGGVRRRISSGALVGTGGGTQTYSVSLQCGDSNRPPISIHGQVWATAVNGDGEPGLVDPFLNF
jgi:hypothetical protein